MMLKPNRLLHLLLPAALGACGGASAEMPAAEYGTTSTAPEPSPPPAAGRVNRKGSGSVTAEIGSGGGSIELTEGPRVVIPSGALSESAEFVLQTTKATTAFLNEESERPIGETFVLSPGLGSANGPIEVSMPLPSMPEGFGEPALSYEYGVGNRVGAEDSQHTRWQYENATYVGGRLVAKVSELSGMRLQFVLTNLEAQ